MPRIDTKRDANVHIGVVTYHDVVNVYSRDRGTLVDVWLNVEEAEELIYALQRGVNVIKGGRDYDGDK